jgi:hypothetical protein
MIPSCVNCEFSSSSFPFSPLFILSFPSHFPLRVQCLGPAEGTFFFAFALGSWKLCVVLLSLYIIPFYSTFHTHSWSWRLCALSVAGGVGRRIVYFFDDKSLIVFSCNLGYVLVDPDVFEGSILIC